MNDRKTLWYVADPMCSWCWGFSPIIENIHQHYSERLNIALIVGGLRPGTKLPIASKQREEILHHWHNVQRLTGQPFQFDGAIPEGFIYDTEIACRSVITVSTIDPNATFSFFKAIQHAFYAEQRNVTKVDVLAQLAFAMGINQQQFRQLFESKEIKEQTLSQFRQAQQWGVQGFPTLIIQNESSYKVLASGYCPEESLCSQLDAWLKT
ncbi:MAG: DsbA family protein [Nitrosomonas sp.]|nr:DsbA family protein [Nitrosomonas sp.]MDP1951746.1 DsbA family protein [Nitrosomonas sp.]